jgi:hypothetical protein
MAVRKLSLNELPPVRRNRDTPIKHTPDWLDTLHHLQGGKFEVLQVEFAKETLALGKSTPERFKRLLQREIAEKQYEPAGFKVRCFFRGRDRAGNQILVIVKEKSGGVKKS